MDIKEIDKLIDKLIEKGINEFELEREGFRIRIRKDLPPVVNSVQNEVPDVIAPAKVGQAVPEEAAAGEEQISPGGNNFHTVASPMVGTFYRAPSPGAKPYVEVGDQVSRGQICCIVEAMKLMNEIAIDVEGVVAEVHAENAQPVEFGEPLFSIEITH